tara:strand:+ start:165 stop:440 length:276 start_codon:yes stop_codon:yes gene_type:complete
MMTDSVESITAFHRTVSKLAGESDLSSEGKTVALFRAALEVGSEELGKLGVMHPMSSLFATTLGILDAECTYGDEEDKDLQDFQTDGQSPN